MAEYCHRLLGTANDFAPAERETVAGANPLGAINHHFVTARRRAQLTPRGVAPHANWCERLQRNRRCRLRVGTSRPQARQGDDVDAQAKTHAELCAIFVRKHKARSEGAPSVQVERYEGSLDLVRVTPVKMPAPKRITLVMIT